MSMVDVPIAVVPAAGLGTRLAPATRAVPKELMPIGPYPMIQLALEEVIQAGIPHAAVVVSPSKPALSDFLARWKRGREVRLTKVSQPRAIGLADAILRVEHLARGRPIALVLPDNVFFPYAGARSALDQVLEGFARTGADITGVIRVAKTAAHTYSNAGLVTLARRSGRPGDIRRLFSKGSGPLRFRSGLSAYKTFARTILLPHFFEYLRESYRKNHGVDEIPALQKIVKRHGFGGVLLRGRGFDAGNPAGYAVAISYWASKASRT